MLASNMHKLELNNLKKEAQKGPENIRKYSMFMLICILIINYGVVLATEIIPSQGIIF